MRIRMPSPALVVAAAALIVALTGTAIAANVVPLAARAKVADNAKKLSGKTPAQVALIPGPATTLDGKTAEAIAATPGPASAVASLVVVQDRRRARSSPARSWIRRRPATPVRRRSEAASRGPTDSVITTLDSRPSSDGASWRLRLASFEFENTNVTLVAVCLK